MIVSIIIPIYNNLKYVERCLQSVEEQTITDFETVVVYDPNLLGVGTLLNRYEERVHMKKVALNQEGVSAARNLGLEHSQGEYVMFLDSDDYLTEHALSDFVTVYRKNPVDLIYGRTAQSFHNHLDFAEEVVEETEEGKKKKEKKKSKKDTTATIDNPIGFLVGNRDNLTQVTVHGCFFKRRFLQMTEIWFSMDLEMFQDSPFMHQVLHEMHKSMYIDAIIYGERKHDDPIQNPSLTQRGNNVLMEEFLLSYALSLKEVGDHQEMSLLLQNGLCEYYLDKMLRYLYRGKNRVLIREAFLSFSRAMRGVDNRVIQCFPRMERKQIHILIRGEIKKAFHTVPQYFKWREKKNSRKSKKAFYLYLTKKYFKKKDLKSNYIVFESFKGRNYADNPRAIYEYMEENYGKQFRYVWVFDKKKLTVSEIIGEPILVKRNSLRYYYYLSRAKYYITNAQQPSWFRKREGQVMIQTWHGTPVKTLGFDVEDCYFSKENYKMNGFALAQQWDYILSDCEYATTCLQSAFRIPKQKILEIGYPRNDVLFRDNKKEIIDEIKEDLGLPLDKKILLYAPTWREQVDSKKKFEFALNLLKLKKRYGKEYIVLIKMSHHMTEGLEITQTELKDFVYNMVEYDEIADLYLVADILITDYSSTMFDFAYLRKPMIFYSYDKEKFARKRGLYFRLEDLAPGPVVHSSKEVIEAIGKLGDGKAYKERYDAFQELFCQHPSGHATKDIVEIMLSK